MGLDSLNPLKWLSFSGFFMSFNRLVTLTQTFLDDVNAATLQQYNKILRAYRLKNPAPEAKEDCISYFFKHVYCGSKEGVGMHSADDRARLATLTQIGAQEFSSRKAFFQAIFQTVYKTRASSEMSATLLNFVAEQLGMKKERNVLKAVLRVQVLESDDAFYHRMGESLGLRFVKREPVAQQMSALRPTY